MTLEALLVIVVRLSNQCFVRHWAHWNYPCESPWLMAISLLSDGDLSALIAELKEKGLTYQGSDGLKHLFIVERLNCPQAQTFLGES